MKKTSSVFHLQQDSCNDIIDTDLLNKLTPHSNKNKYSKKGFLNDELAFHAAQNNNNN